jgi:hypothetical protein
LQQVNIHIVIGENGYFLRFSPLGFPNAGQRPIVTVQGFGQAAG